MSDIILRRLSWEQDAVRDQKEQRSAWLQQEANQLIDDLFAEIDPLAMTAAPKPSNRFDADLLDVSWMDAFTEDEWSEAGDGYPGINDDYPLTPPQHRQGLLWPRPEEKQAAATTAVPEAVRVGLKTAQLPWWKPALLALGGCCFAASVGVIAGQHFQVAQTKSVIAATTPATSAEVEEANRQFANYVDQALKRIEANGSLPTPLPTVGITPSASPSTLLTTTGTQLNQPGVPAIAPRAPGQTSTAAPATTTQPSQTQSSLGRIYVNPTQPPNLKTTDVPLPSNGATLAAVTPSTSVLPPVASAPATGFPNQLPALTPGVPPLSLASATPMQTPQNPQNKVIGILESGLQSTLMVENNGSYHNFRIGDAIGDQGWQLVQITQGKAVLQRGNELKTLNEGQFF
jgi:hypothetical protein